MEYCKSQFLTFFYLCFFSTIIFFSSCKKDSNRSCIPSFSCFTDIRDGQVYKTVTLCNQTWMAENLRYDVPNVWTNSISIDTFPNSNLNPEYGRLYDWHTAKNVCPNGWHLASHEEWEVLEAALGVDVSESSSYRAGSLGLELKSSQGWEIYNGKSGNGTNSLGFNAFPAGFYRRVDDYLYNSFGKTTFWTSTQYYSSLNEEGAYVRELSSSNDNIHMFMATVKDGFSCRCIKN